jgi:REP element-mobilizing transposase RayT
MSRPLRIEYPGACYHVTARGNFGQALFTDIHDAEKFLELLALEIAQHRWRCHSYCLVENHYHLVIETPEPNLGRGMGRLNMRYSQWFGRRHQRTGHLFQGRYKAILFEKDRHLLEICRHVLNNPVRLDMVNQVDLWRWSSYRALAGSTARPEWLTTDVVLTTLDADNTAATSAWCNYVADASNTPSPWENLRSGHYLGSEAFLHGLKNRIDDTALDQVASALANPNRPTADRVQDAVASAARVPPDAVLDRSHSPDAFRATVYLLRRASNLPLRQVAEMGAVSQGRVSQIQRQIEEAGGLSQAFPWAEELESLVG